MTVGVLQFVGLNRYSFLLQTAYQIMDGAYPPPRLNTTSK